MLPSIQRKSLLNKSALGFWCVNHVQGCSHGCRYPCHAFMLARRRGRVADLAAWCSPVLVGNALALLERELPRRPEVARVHLSLTTDPFMFGVQEVVGLSLRVIERVNQAGIPCSVLTKGAIPVELADTPRFRDDNVYGVSLASLDEGFRQRWEPGAAPYARRIAHLRALHERGCRTLVHLEPYPTPNLIEQDLRQVLHEVGFVDQVQLGGWNYNPVAAEYAGRAAFYREQARVARAFCGQRGIAFESWVER